MSNPFSIDSSIIDLYHQGMEAIISDLGKNCVLVYPPKVTQCTNCIYDPIGKKSSNRYKTGGPIPFSNGAICPSCNGQGNIYENVEETVKMRLIWSPKEYRNLGVPVDDPSSICRTTCSIVYLPKIQRATEVIIDSDKQGLVRYRCKKIRAVKPHGIQSSEYVIAYWQINGSG